MLCCEPMLKLDSNGDAACSTVYGKTKAKRAQNTRIGDKSRCKTIWLPNDEGRSKSSLVVTNGKEGELNT